MYSLSVLFKPYVYSISIYLSISIIIIQKIVGVKMFNVFERSHKLTTAAFI